MIEQVDAGWSVREFHGIDLGDERLNRRLLALAETFGAHPTAPINPDCYPYLFEVSVIPPK